MDLAQTRGTWEAIGESYAEARTRPWERVVRWAEHLPRDGRILDLACGNGRHAAALAASHDVVASDFALALLKNAERNVPGRAVCADATDLPFASGAFAGALFIAALHNIPGRTRRISALAELRRVLEPGSPALITVWNRWHPAKAPGFLAEIPHRLFGDHEIEMGDAWVDWATGREKVARFYHFYSRRELREDLRAAGFAVESLEAVAIARTYPDNLFASVRRPALSS